jgi:hypothetical protein
MDPATSTALVAVLDTVGRLGAGALLAGAIYALVTRRVRPAGDVVDLRADFAARLAEQQRVSEERLRELREDRDGWRRLAESSWSKVDRLTDVVELLSGKRVPSDAG